MAQQRDALGRFCAIQAPKMKRVRGKDRAKLIAAQGWEAVEVVHTFPDGHYIGEFVTHNDLEKFGSLMGHCAGSHTWLVAIGTEHLLSVFSADHVPHNSIHVRTIETLFIATNHPRAANVSPYPTTFVSPAYYDSDAGENDRGNVGVDRYESPEQKIIYCKQNIADYERYKENAMAKAKQYGPLGPNNPYKYDIDDYNRGLNSYRQQLKDLEAAAEAAKKVIVDKKELWIAGRRVLYKGHHILPFRAHDKGWGGGCSQYHRMTSEWLDTLPDVTNEPVDFWAFDKPKVATIEELRTAGKAWYAKKEKVAVKNVPSYYYEEGHEYEEEEYF